MNIEKQFIKGRKLILENVIVEWAYLVNRDNKFGKDQWKITCRLEEKLALSMKKVGFNIRNTKDGKKFKEGDAEYWYLECVKKFITRDGKEFSAPYVKGRDGETDEDGSKVGNGSRCNVAIFAKYQEVNDEMFLPAYLNGVQILELVEFNPSGFSNVDADGEENVPF